MDELDGFLPKRKRLAPGLAPAGPPLLFTYAELRAVTQRALEEQHERLSLQFQTILRDRLHGTCWGVVARGGPLSGGCGSHWWGHGRAIRKLFAVQPGLCVASNA
jgi:hypothetical protein